jgi:hypothetical protein
MHTRALAHVLSRRPHVTSPDLQGAPQTCTLAHMRQNTASPSLRLSALSSGWRIRWSGEAAVALADLAAAEGSKAAGLVAAVGEVAHWARLALEGRAPQWVLNGKPTPGPSPLRGGIVQAAKGVKGSWVRPSPSTADRRDLALLEVVFAHANSTRLTLADLLRTIAVRAVEIRQARDRGLRLEC